MSQTEFSTYCTAPSLLCSLSRGDGGLQLWFFLMPASWKSLCLVPLSQLNADATRQDAFLHYLAWSEVIEQIRAGWTCLVHFLLLSLFVLTTCILCTVAFLKSSIAWLSIHVSSSFSYLFSFPTLPSRSGRTTCSILKASPFLNSSNELLLLSSLHSLHFECPCASQARLKVDRPFCNWT